jgi:hypothetical protein
MRSVKITLAVAIALMIVAIGVVLSRAPLIATGANSVGTASPVAFTRGNTSSCQTGTLPQGTSGIRVSLASGVGPWVRITVFSGSQIITRGERAGGWGLAENVLVPVRAVSRTIPDARICTAVGRVVEPMPVLGAPIRPGTPHQLSFKDIKLRLEYLRPGPKSWLALASSITHHMGLGHAASGSWLAFFVLAVMVAIVVLAARLTLEELR